MKQPSLDIVWYAEALSDLGISGHGGTNRSAARPSCLSPSKGGWKPGGGVARRGPRFGAVWGVCPALSLCLAIFQIAQHARMPVNLMTPCMWPALLSEGGPRCCVIARRFLVHVTRAFERAHLSDTHPKGLRSSPRTFLAVGLHGSPARMSKTVVPWESWCRGQARIGD